MSHRSTQLAFTFAYIRIHPPRIQIVYHNRLPSKPRSLVPLRCPKDKKMDSSSRCLVMRRPLTIWNSYEFWFLVLRSAFFPLFFFSSVPHALLRTSRPWHVSSHRYLHRTRITHSFGRGHGAYIGVLALPFFFFLSYEVVTRYERTHTKRDVMCTIPSFSFPHSVGILRTVTDRLIPDKRHCVVRDDLEHGLPICGVPS